MKGLQLIEEVLSNTLHLCFPGLENLEIGLRPLVDYEAGDLASAICIRAGQRLKKTAQEVGSSIIEALPSGFEPKVYMLEEQLTLRLPSRPEWLMGAEGEAAAFPCPDFIVAIPPVDLFTSRIDYLRVCALGLFAAQLAKRLAPVRFYNGSSLLLPDRPEAIFRKALLSSGADAPAQKISLLCQSLSRDGSAILFLASSALISNQLFAEWIASERAKRRTVRVKLIEPDWYGSSASYLREEDLLELESDGLLTILFHLASELRPWELDVTACLRGEFHPPRERLNELALRLSSRKGGLVGSETPLTEDFLERNPWLRALILDLRFYPTRLQRALLEGELMAFNLSLNRLIRQITRLLNQPGIKPVEAPRACFFSNWLNSGIGQVVKDMLKVFESSGANLSWPYGSCPRTENKSYGEVDAKQ